MTKIEDCSGAKIKKMDVGSQTDDIEQFKSRDIRQTIAANTIRTSEIQSNDTKSLLCIGNDVLDGVHVLDGITQPFDGYAHIAVADTNDVPVEIINSAMITSANDLSILNTYTTDYNQEDLPMVHFCGERKLAIDWIIRNYKKRKKYT